VIRYAGGTTRFDLGSGEAWIRKMVAISDPDTPTILDVTARSESSNLSVVVEGFGPDGALNHGVAWAVVGLVREALDSQAHAFPGIAELYEMVEINGHTYPRQAVPDYNF
jgi:hypothetical protein